MPINERPRDDGGTSYLATWIAGGGRYKNKIDTPRCSETFTSRERAEAFLDDVRRAGWRWPEGWVKGRGYVKPEELLQGQVTVDQVAAKHFEYEQGRVAKGRKQPYTHHRNRRMYEIHIKPSFGHLSFAAVDEEDIEEWFELQLGYDAAPKSIHNRHGLLHHIMRHGQQRLKLRGDNPCSLSELPIVENTRDIRFFQHGEWAIIRGCLRPDARLISDTALATAGRWGELSAIQIGDCMIPPDTDDVVAINFRRVWTKRAPDDPDPIRRELGENHSWKIKPAPKGRESRFVTVTGDTARELIALMVGRSGTEYLFTTRHGNPWRYNDFHSDRWQPAVRLAERSGLAREATTFHMVRHTAAVWALAAGVAIHDVSMMLGHKDIQMTWNIYGGALHMFNPEIARKLENQTTLANRAILPVNMPTADEIAAMPVRTRPRRAS